MARQPINYGSFAEDGTGDGLRVAFVKTDNNFIELYDRLAIAEADILQNQLDIADNVIDISDNTDAIVQNALDIAAIGGVKTKIIDAGDWDMDTALTLPVAVAHGLTLANIRGVTLMIRNDANTLYSPLYIGVGANAAVTAGATTLKATRETAGSFDTVNYSTTSYNRGYFIVSYIVP